MCLICLQIYIGAMLNITMITYNSVFGLDFDICMEFLLFFNLQIVLTFFPLWEL